MEAVRKMTRSITGYKGQAQLQYNRCDHNFNTIEGEPTSKAAMEDMRKHFLSAERSVQRCRDLYVEISSLVDEGVYAADFQPRYNEMEAKFLTFEEKREKAQYIHERALRDVPPPPVIDGGGGGGGGGGGARAPPLPKVDIHLQPDTLHDDTVPLEYMEWKQKFDMYYKLSGMTAQEEKLKISFLKMVVAPQVTTRCDIEASPTLTDALAKIDQDYWETHPNRTLRLAYGRMRQRSQQKFSDFAAELKRQGELANVSDMT